MFVSKTRTCPEGLEVFKVDNPPAVSEQATRVQISLFTSIWRYVTHGTSAHMLLYSPLLPRVIFSTRLINLSDCCFPSPALLGFILETIDSMSQVFYLFMFWFRKDIMLHVFNLGLLFYSLV